MRKMVIERAFIWMPEHLKGLTTHWSLSVWLWKVSHNWKWSNEELPLQAQLSLETWLLGIFFPFPFADRPGNGAIMMPILAVPVSNAGGTYAKIVSRSVQASVLFSATAQWSRFMEVPQSTGAREGVTGSSRHLSRPPKYESIGIRDKKLGEWEGETRPRPRHCSSSGQAEGTAASDWLRKLFLPWMKYNASWLPLTFWMRLWKKCNSRIGLQHALPFIPHSKKRKRKKRTWTFG